jgi:hypothetical protein
VGLRRLTGLGQIEPFALWVLSGCNSPKADEEAAWLFTRKQYLIIADRRISAAFHGEYPDCYVIDARSREGVNP